jgi:hypothetical protein
MGFVLRMVALICFVLSVWYAVRMHSIDRKIQTYRIPEIPAHRYALVPLRWQREMYQPEGTRLVDEAWRCFRRMLASAILGMLLLAFVSD